MHVSAESEVLRYRTRVPRPIHFGPVPFPSRYTTMLVTTLIKRSSITKSMNRQCEQKISRMMIYGQLEFICKLGFMKLFDI